MLHDYTYIQLYAYLMLPLGGALFDLILVRICLQSQTASKHVKVCAFLAASPTLGCLVCAWGARGCPQTHWVGPPGERAAAAWCSLSQIQTSLSCPFTVCLL